VDDVEANLYIAKGMMAPYGLDIETAENGSEALDMITQGNIYDVIFMDHMMPEMDGMEAVKILRESGYSQPIVALTANAVIGQADIFLKNGFDGFISKPINLPQLNTVLNKFIRADTGNAGDLPPNPQEKITVSLNATSKVSPNVLRIFCRDAKKAIVTLQATIADGDIKLFTITAHAMKSALANVGERETSELARKLEDAGRKGDTDYINVNAEDFIETLEAVIAKHSPSDADGDRPIVEEDTE
jgi:CheY-like chemotaxis protein